MLSEENTSLKTQVRIDQVRMIYDATPLAFTATVINCVILSILVWSVIDHVVIVIWAITAIFVGLFRLLLSVYFHRVNPSADDINPWVLAAKLGTILAGTVWGSAGYFLFAQDSVAHQLILTVFVAGMSSGAASTLSAQRGPAIIYCIFSIVPLEYCFALTEHEFTWAMLIGLPIFLVILITTTSRHSRVIDAMYVERFQRQRGQERDSIRNRVLELLAAGESLDIILEAIVLGIEEEFPDMLCSILLVDSAGEYLVGVIAPNLPDSYKAKFVGLKISQDMGLGVDAAYTGKRVVEENIQNNSSWKNCTELAEQVGLVSCWSEPIFATSGHIVGTFGIYHKRIHSPTDREKSALKQMAKLAGIAVERSRNAEALELAGMVYQNSSEAMMITDDENQIIAINPAFTDVTGYTLSEVAGNDPKILSSGVHDNDFFKEMWQALDATGHWQGEIWNRRKNGEKFAEWLTINTIFDDSNKVHRRVSLFSDITVKKDADALIWTQANYDALTKLPNRRLFGDRLNQGLKAAKREDHYLAILFIDLDRFKEVNDTFGHHTGDELLIKAAERISNCVRGTDTIARLGGDEFVVVLNELKHLNGLDKIAQTIINSLSNPYQIEEELCHVTASIGITVYPEDATSADDLLRNADQAMFDAKQKGRNCYSFFTKRLQEDAQRRMLIVNDIYRAMDAGEFSVHFQPILDLATGRIVKAEALLRWQHHREGYIGPDSFIPIAEETGAIHEIGNMVFEQAIKSLLHWRSNYDQDFQVSINKSPVQLMQEEVDHLDWLEKLEEAGIDGAGLVIEITEGVVMNLTTVLNDRLLSLRDAGIQIAIDDFGTGYSSLAYLKKFDIDYLKLDRSYVSNLQSDARNLVLSEAIIVLAHKLGFEVVAEGVETEAQFRILKNIGCDYAQGFLFSKAVTPEKFDKLLQEQGQSTRIRQREFW